MYNCSYNADNSRDDLPSSYHTLIGVVIHGQCGGSLHRQESERVSETDVAHVMSGCTSVHVHSIEHALEILEAQSLAVEDGLVTCPSRDIVSWYTVHTVSRA